MNKRQWVLITVLQVVLTAAVAGFIYFAMDRNEGPPGSRDAHQYPECHGHVEGLPLCEIRGSDLFSASERIDGRLVRVTGYLAVDHGVVTLFPSESDYLRRVNNHALIVRASFEQQQRLVTQYGYRYVRLIGTYRSRDEASMRTGKIGAIHVTAEEPLRPRGIREGADKILINIDDVGS